MMAKYQRRQVKSFHLGRIPTEEGRAIKREYEQNLRDYLYYITGNKVEFTIDRENKTLRTTHYIEGGQSITSDDIDIKEYIRTTREYEKERTRLEKWTKRLGITAPAYQFSDVGDVVYFTSRGQGHRGLVNRIETMKKMLQRDPETGLNTIQKKALSLYDLREAKMEAYGDSDRIMKAAGIDLSQYKRPLAGGGYGGFKSKSKRDAYMIEFSKIVVDEYESASEGLFHAWVYENDNNYALKTEYEQDVSEYLATLSEEELTDLATEYIVDTLDTKIAQGLEKGTNVDELVEALEKTQEAHYERHNPNSKGRKKR